MVQARQAFGKKGMRLAKTIQCESFTLDLFANPWHDPAVALAVEADERFCTYCGTLIYKGLTGVEATRTILKDFIKQGIGCLDAANGNYCLIVGDQTSLKCVTDRAGLHHVYHANDNSAASNSFIAIACSLPRHTFTRQEVLEYILFGATFGDSTLLNEVKLLGAESMIEVQGEALRVVTRKTVWTPESQWSRKMTNRERVGRTLELLDDYYNQLVRAFGSHVIASISGGYDSRLNLGLLRRHGVTPSLFVYGSVRSADVAIAKVICRQEGLQLLHLDRADSEEMGPDYYWRNQEDVFHGLDGLTQYGYACEPFEISHRRARAIGGSVVVNGGGGEIWRDYWKLPDRAMSGREFARAYFGGRESGYVSDDGFSIRVYDGIATKIEYLTGTVGLLPSHMVQSLYARLRLRFWQGKNNSVDNFLGYALTPFSEHHFSVPAMWIPMVAKRHGWFEAQLIRCVSSQLADYPSSHGFSISAGPRLGSRLKSAITRHLPIAVRESHRRRQFVYSRRYFQSERYVRARFGDGNLHVRAFVEPRRLKDSSAFSRALSVERMLRKEWL